MRELEKESRGGECGYEGYVYKKVDERVSRDGRLKCGVGLAG